MNQRDGWNGSQVNPTTGVVRRSVVFTQWQRVLWEMISVVKTRLMWSVWYRPTQSSWWRVFASTVQLTASIKWWHQKTSLVTLRLASFGQEIMTDGKLFSPWTEPCWLSAQKHKGSFLLGLIHGSLSTTLVMRMELIGGSCCYMKLWNNQETFAAEMVLVLAQRKYVITILIVRTGRFHELE